MKEVLAHIEKKKQEFAKLDFFRYLADETIDPMQRLSWAPCLAPLAMGFPDLNKHFLRREPASNEIQELVNKHTYEDDYHWEWFLEDITTLGFNNSQHFNDSLRFIWGKETEKTRLVCQRILLHIFQADSIMLMIIIKAVEATWNVALPLTLSVTQELHNKTQKNYYYFGKLHFEIENSHSTEEEDVEKIILNLDLTQDKKNQAFNMIDNIFEAFSECVDEMMRYANNHPAPFLSEALSNNLNIAR